MLMLSFLCIFWRLIGIYFVGLGFFEGVGSQMYTDVDFFLCIFGSPWAMFLLVWIFEGLGCEVYVDVDLFYAYVEARMLCSCGSWFLKV